MGWGAENNNLYAISQVTTAGNSIKFPSKLLGVRGGFRSPEICLQVSLVLFPPLPNPLAFYSHPFFFARKRLLRKLMQAQSTVIDFFNRMWKEASHAKSDWW